MLLSEFARALAVAPDHPVHLMLPGGDFVPAHYHVTEVGRVRKDFIDCGGTTRSSTACVLQVWVATDTDHRLTAGKLAGILKLVASIMQGDDPPVEVEYEAGVVSQYPVAAAEATPAGVLFHLGTKHTDCLAQDRCGVGAAADCCG